MGLFNRKQPVEKSLFEQINDKTLEVRDILDQDKKEELSTIMLVRGPESGSSLVQGTSENIIKSILATMAEDPTFADVIRMCAGMSEAKGVNIPSPSEIMPDGIKGIFDKMGGKSSTIVDLPNGDKALAVDTSNIENLGKDEIDDIVDALLKNRPEDGQSEE